MAGGQGIGMAGLTMAVRTLPKLDKPGNSAVGGRGLVGGAIGIGQESQRFIRRCGPGGQRRSRDHQDEEDPQCR